MQSVSEPEYLCIVCIIWNSYALFQVSCPEDYRAWLVSMYSLFGTKWLNLHRGPMWSVESTAQGEQLHKDSLLTSEVSISSVCN